MLALGVTGFKFYAPQLTPTRLEEITGRPA